MSGAKLGVRFFKVTTPIGVDFIDRIDRQNLERLGRRTPARS